MFDCVNKHSDSAGKLLSTPDESAVTYSRSEANYENLSVRFLLKDKNFGRQYAHVYSSRLAELRPELEKIITSKYGGYIHVSTSAMTWAIMSSFWQGWNASLCIAHEFIMLLTPKRMLDT